MYGFGEENEPQAQAQEPAWFRSRMDKVSSEIADLKAENDRLKAEQAKRAVKDKLTALGYAPQVADLYQGKPEEVDTWVGTYGAAFAKAEAAGEQQAAQQGTPATTVSPESQQAMTAMSAAGSGSAPALSGEDALVARLNAAQTKEEFDAIMREAGNPRY